MTSTDTRPTAELDEVPRRVEAARIGAAGWQLVRAAARTVAARPARGTFKTELIKQAPETFTKLGPTYVKFGQIIASSPGTFGEPLSREFRTLLDAVPAAEPRAVHRLIREELGDEPRKLFRHFEEAPFASASIAQVHFATLHSGQDVVVKVQRPDIRRRVAADLQILKRLAPVAECTKAGRRLSIRHVVDDFAEHLAEELDFRIEARSMKEWVSNLNASQLGNIITVPEVYWDFTGKRVLTMERVHGVRIDDIAAIRAQGSDGEDLVKALLFATFEGGLRHGLFHGDLHAGNVLVDDTGRAVFLDFGIMGRIDTRIRSLVCELVYALLVTHDHATMGRAVLELGGAGTIEPDAETIKTMQALAAPMTMTSIGDLSYADVGAQFSALADAYDVRLPRELVLIGKQFLYVERYVKLLAPQWELMKDPDFSAYVAGFLAELTGKYRDELGRADRQ
ncbi:AarF/UbiB family protein [Mycobacterium sp. 1274756.6]|uniref:ABC1 kinase family protein n=1 Tax=Mycobacterium sp. 1274756.6 TaxID=1834076 RepID=UPI0007FFA98F|nr:AarF/UbiB family protein [Mycobacterium sp. 1274756.6]OBJ68014.1 hypothetical protein A5643_16195 [Mycobacterium sp. 1274756.6]